MYLTLLLQLTTIADVIIYALIAGVYFYFKQKTSPRVAQSYTYLTLAWVFITATAIPGVIRNMFPPTMPHIHILCLKSSMIAGAFAFTCLYMFIGKLYENFHFRYLFYLLGWLVTVPLYHISALLPGYSLAEGTAGVEVLLPPFAFFSMLFVWLLLIGSFTFTAIFFQLQLIKHSLKTKIVKVSLAYALFWSCYLGESLGLVFALLGGIGIILIRSILAITALYTIIAWAGKTTLIKAITP